MAAESSALVGLVPTLAFSSVFLLVYGLQQALDRRSARLAKRLGRFTATPEAGMRGSREDLLRKKRRFSTIKPVDHFLGRQDFAARMDQQLANAGLPLRVGEYLFIRWALALGLGGLAAGATLNPLLAFPAAAIGYFAPAVYVAFRRSQRLALFNEQLVAALGLISGGLRAGYSFLQGVEAVVRELPAPLSDEFRVVLEDLRIGVPVEDSLLSLCRRVPTEDVDMTVTAMIIQRSSGGNLAEILDNIAHTIRERIRIRREVNTLTAQERMSSYVLGALPIVAFISLIFLNPEYLDLLFGTPLGQAMLGAAALLGLAGFYVIRRIIDIKL